MPVDIRTPVTGSADEIVELCRECAGKSCEDGSTCIDLKISDCPDGLIEELNMTAGLGSWDIFVDWENESNGGVFLNTDFDESALRKMLWIFEQYGVRVIDIA